MMDPTGRTRRTCLTGLTGPTLMEITFWRIFGKIWI